MKKSIVCIGIVLVACGLLLAACGGGESKAPDTKAPAAPTKAGDKAAPPAMPGKAEAPKPEAPAAGAPAAAAPAAAAPAAAGGALDATTIVGTSWKKDDASFTFEANGELKVNGAIPGKWKLEGNMLEVSALGNTYKAEIKGDKILFEGKECEKVK